MPEATEERLVRIEDKLDKIAEKLTRELGRHEIELAKLRMQTRYIAITLGIALLGGGSAAGVVKLFSGV